MLKAFETLKYSAVKVNLMILKTIRTIQIHSNDSKNNW
jgi:hypothetical protein